MTESDALNAMAIEAKWREISYGNLVANTTEWERHEIIRAYCAAKRREERKRRNGR